MELSGSKEPGAALRVLILFSDIGEGHAATAHALAANIAAVQPETTVVLENGLAHVGWFLRFLQRDMYRAQLAHLPWLYGFWYRVFDLFRLPRALGALAICTLGWRPLRRLVLAHAPDVVVSTDPRLTVILGHLRLRKRIDMPVCASLTDFGGLKFWVHPGVDVHLVPHRGLLPELERLVGNGSGRLIRPPVHPRFYGTLSRAKARELLALPEGVPVVLLSGGGWGAGDLRGALRAALALPDAHVVCVCGHNQSCQEELRTLVSTWDRAAERVRVLGFSGEMSELLAAADVLVHSTGGVTCLEASVRRCPVIIYGAPQGHVRTVARAMAELREAAVAHSSEELTLLLKEAAAGKGVLGEDTRRHPEAGQVILHARPRVSSWGQIVPWLIMAKGTAHLAAPELLEEELVFAEEG